MKFQGKELFDMSLFELAAAQSWINESEMKREKASMHPKFEKMEFPPPNKLFLEIKQNIEIEISKRTEGTWK